MTRSSLPSRNLLLIYAMSALVYFSQGIGGLASQPLFFYLKETLGLPPSTLMYLGSVTTIPWMIKPLYGWISDTFPLWGYRRKSYMIASGLLSASTAAFLGIIPVLSLVPLYAVLVLDSLGGAIKDVAVDGIMVEEGQRLGLTGRIQAIQWGSLTLASVVTGLAGGYIAERFDYHLGFKLVALFPAMVACLTLFYDEKPAPVSAQPVSMKEVLKNRQLLLSMLFLFLLWFSPSFGVPISFKMRDELHFSKLYMGFLGTLGSAFSILGAVWYWRVSRRIDLKKWLTLSTVVSALSTFAYLYLTKTSILLYTLLFGIANMATQLIIMDFCARICPKGKEATTFALIMSVLNFGTFMSGIAGGKLYDWVGYHWLVIISGVTTLLCLLLIPHLELASKSPVAALGFRCEQGEERGGGVS
ncbi:MAG: MFS transporter [Candidatus Omnitrophica bacterium]|nr:MFS transporter [Candidatus Omnitrophota bacterium]